MRFPVEVSSGKRIPESVLRLGCNFPIEPLGETATQNLRPKRDVVSPRTEAAARPLDKMIRFPPSPRDHSFGSQDNADI